MSWLTEILFPRRTDLEVRIQHYVKRTETAEAAARAALANVKRVIQNCTDAGQLRRLHRALRACQRYRRELAANARLIRNQQRQLDNLLGLNNPDVLNGASWQARRQDKRKEYTS